MSANHATANAAGPKGVSVVIPVYNSGEGLAELAKRLGDIRQQVSPEFEVVLVNDGSQDDSWKIICDLIEEHPWIRGFNLMRNYGQHNALLCGIREARHEVIVTMDDDLQHPPEEIPKLLRKLAEGHDVVYGTPEKKQHTLYRNVASRVTRYVLRRALGAETAEDVSPFRAFHTWIRDSFHRYEDPFVSIDVLLTWGARRFAVLPVRHDPRQIGASTYTFRKLAGFALDMMTGFTTLPLRLASFLGFVFTIFGFVILACVVGSYLIRGGTPPGFPFLASTIAIFSGAQLFALGIIGEYLARMHVRMMHRPPYVIYSRTEPDESARKPRNHREE